MKIFGIFILIMVMAGPVHAVEFGDYGNYYGAKYVRNYDGGTITFNLPGLRSGIGSKTSIWIFGVDVPEIRGKCQQEKELAVEAKNLVASILSEADSINLINMQRGKHLRYVGGVLEGVWADVLVDGAMIKNSLIESGLAVAYGGRTVKDWCE